LSITNIVSELIDNGGRRIGLKRREFSYANHLPNGRSKKDRRSGVDRRSGLERRKDRDRRSGMIIFKKIQRPDNDLREGIKRRSDLDRRISFTGALVA
jgi:hypothetical protein